MPLPGTYTLSGTLTDTSNLCSARITRLITLHQKPVADFSYTPDHITEKFDLVTFTGSDEPGSKHAWHLYNGFQALKDEGLSFNHVFGEPGIYTMAYVETNKQGCSDTAIKAIEVHPPAGIYVPNCFSPNLDGLNDTFVPVFNGVVKFELQVFDRWGQRLFATTQKGEGWDGTSRGIACEQGVYVWKMQVNMEEGTRSLQGHLTLLR